MKEWWKKHGHVPTVLAASLLGSLAGYEASHLMPGGFGFGALVVGPLLAFLGSGIAGIYAAGLSGRKKRKWGIIVGLLGACLLASGLSLMASLPGAASADDGNELWKEYALTIAVVAGFTSFGASLLGTEASREQETRAERVVRVKSPERTNADPMAAKASHADALKRAYDVMGAPTRDNVDLVASTRDTLRVLDDLARSADPLAPEARRVSAKLRSVVGRELLDRSWKSLQAAQAGQKAGRSNSFRAASLAERLAQEALEIADSERDEQVALKANQCLQAARMLNARGNKPSAIDDELKALTSEVAALRAEAERGRAVSGEDSALLMRLVALQGLGKVTGRADVEAAVEQLLADVKGFTASSTIAHAGGPGENLEPHLSKLTDGMKVVRELDGGGFGRTFLCTEGPPMNRQVVVKTLRSEWLASDSVRKAFKAEANVEGAFQHENVPRVLYYREIAGRPFKVMEFVTGGSLRDQLKRWRMQNLTCEPIKAVRIVREVTDVLIDLQAHYKGAVHRDLKPENILLDGKGHAKLTDFGLAHVPRPLGDGPFKAGTPLGTVYYMSPEQARGEALVTPASDVYAIGVILYELFTGTFPYPVTERTKSAFRDYVKRGELVIREDGIPAPILALIRRCLEKDPAARPSVDELQLALKEAEGQLQQMNLTKSMWSSDGVPSEVFHSMSIVESKRDPATRASELDGEMLT